MSIPQVLSFPSSASFPMRMGSLFFAAIEAPNPPIVSVQRVFQKDDAAHILYRDKKSGGQEGMTVLNLSGHPRLSRESRTYVAERPIIEPTSVLGTVTEAGLWIWPLFLFAALAPVVLGARHMYGFGEKMIWKMDRHAHAQFAAFRGRLDPAIYGALKMALRNEWMPPSLQGAHITMTSVMAALAESHRLDFYVMNTTGERGRLTGSEWLDSEGFTIARAGNDSTNGTSIKRVVVSFRRFTGKNAAELFAVKPQSVTELTSAYVDPRDVDFTNEVREYNASRRRG